MEKNPKACEPCRRRKVRCDGQTPCNRCEKKPAECVYRLRTRVRKSAAHRSATSKSTPGGQMNEPPCLERPLHSPSDPAISPPGFSRQLPEGGGPESNPAYNNVYQSVAAAHDNEIGTEWPENSRLFYGPASQFAFLQQVHRGIISSSCPNGQQEREVQEGGPGLDLFLQRSFFFGTASRVDTSAFLRPAINIFPEVPIEQARLFMEKFKDWAGRIMPFFSDAELVKMLNNLYSNDEAHARPSQVKALTLAVLALGALATPHTDVAELLLARAKYEAVIFDDTVSLQMIQFSLLLADYHTSMGRPNLVYLCVGTACRKAFALGLHREAASGLARSEDVQKYRTTLWCLYSLENWYSMTVGRESSLKVADISTPFPEKQPLVVSFSRLAHISESVARTIYTQRYDSLRKLYTAAESIYSQLREFAEKHGIGSAKEEHSSMAHNPASLMLHNLFYHTILLTYRPFLVADYALASRSEPQTAGGGAMWLRQACRNAIDSAQDCILYAHTQIGKYESCRTSRYNGFFFESSCAVLFFDMLRHPSKYPYNVEFINMALQSLDVMIDDEPVTNARKSIRQILRVVEETISRTASASALTDPQLHQTANPSLPSPASFLSHEQPLHATSHVQFPSLNAPSQQLIYFPDLGGDGVGGSALGVPGMDGGEADALTAAGEGLDPLSHFHYDVLATDLYSFFPLNMTPPSAAGNEAGALGGDGGPGRAE